MFVMCIYLLNMNIHLQEKFRSTLLHQVICYIHVHYIEVRLITIMDIMNYWI